MSKAVQKKILVCGLGSMGKRRIRILKSCFPTFNILGVDNNTDRARKTGQTDKIETHNDFYTAFDDFCPDAVFACTSPLEHEKIVLHALENGAHTFSEINLSTKGYDKILSTSKSHGLIAFLSSTFLYRDEIAWIIDKVKNSKISYRYHTGQYLPLWHPWEEHSQFFVSDKKTSAIKEIMAIEFPWMIKAFGNVVDYRVMNFKISQLDLAYRDTLHLILEHENRSCGAVTFDCVSIRPNRKLDIYNDKVFYEWHGTFDSLKEYDILKKKMVDISLSENIIQDDNYNESIVENPYIEEVKDFFSAIENKTMQSSYGYDQDRIVLDLIRKIIKPDE
jgi:predicted dehydrogenase